VNEPRPLLLRALLLIGLALVLLPLIVSLTACGGGDPEDDDEPPREPISACNIFTPSLASSREQAAIVMRCPS
jgi:hypothetical protein